MAAHESCSTYETPLLARTLARAACGSVAEKPLSAAS